MSKHSRAAEDVLWLLIRLLLKQPWLVDARSTRRVRWTK